ncbi:MAG: hypothetical protein ACLVB5_04470 [Christensenellales bacterium]
MHNWRNREFGATALIAAADSDGNQGETNRIPLLYRKTLPICAYIPDVKAVTMEELGEYMLGIRKMSGEEIGGVMHEQQEH